MTRAFLPAPAPNGPAGPPKPSKDAALGRSHRAKVGKAKLKQAIDLTRETLGVPADYRIGITPGSDTGRRVEMARCGSLIGRRARSTVLAWESFGEGWVTDVVQAASSWPTPDTLSRAPYGELPDHSPRSISTTTSSSTWNGTDLGPFASRREMDSRPIARA